MKTIKSAIYGFAAVVLIVLIFFKTELAPDYNKIILVITWLMTLAIIIIEIITWKKNEK